MMKDPTARLNERRDPRPDQRECAMLIAHLLVSGTTGVKAVKEVTRARLSEATLCRLCERQWLTPAFLLEVREWLFRAGWLMFPVGRRNYAVVKVSVIRNWGRISARRIKDDLEKVGRGEFDFRSLEHLLLGSESTGEDED
ncbi:MAG: hypothetical protein WBF58_01495 [Xanthobacteraceae bacterium]